MVVLVVLSTFTIFTAAGKVVPDGINASRACDDLETMGYDLSDYPRDESANFISVIDFTEYGYHHSGDQRYYGLYIYVYNPSGKKLSTTGNAVELSFNHKDTGETGYVKYNLRVIDVSDDVGNEYVFYKFFVSNSSAIGANIGKYRTYKLSSIELKYEEKGVSKPKSFKVAGSYAFSGYQENFGPSGSNLPLHCNYSTIEVIDVELHGASWYTDTSDLGEDYRYEVSSVYFNIPNYYINKYGDLDDETSGLYSVNGIYAKSVTNGLVCSGTAYNDFSQYEGKVLSSQTGYKNASLGSGFGFYSDYETSYNDPFYLFTADVTFNMELYQQLFVFVNHYTYSSKHPVDALLHIVKGNPYDAFISQTEWQNEFESGNRAVWNTASKLPVMGSINFGDLGRVQEYNITVKDDSLNESIKSYATKIGYTQDMGKIERWLKKFYYGELLSDADGYSEIRPIIEIDAGLFGATSGVYDIEAVADNLFLTKTDAEALKQFVSNKSSDNHIYLMRFDVNPYYSTEVMLSNDVSAFDTNGYDYNGVYFEKVVYTGFDILSFTFKDVAGNYKTVPVSCDPIDIIGSIVPEPDDDNGFDRIKNDISDRYSELKTMFDDLFGSFSSLNGVLRTILILLIVAVLVALFVVAIKYVGPLVVPLGHGIVRFFTSIAHGIFRFFTFIVRGIGRFFSWLGSVFGWIFGELGSVAKWTYNNVDKFKDKAVAAVEVKDGINSYVKKRKHAKETKERKQKRKEMRLRGEKFKITSIKIRTKPKKIYSKPVVQKLNKKK